MIETEALSAEVGAARPAPRLRVGDVLSRAVGIYVGRLLVFLSLGALLALYEIARRLNLAAAGGALIEVLISVVGVFFAASCHAIVILVAFQFMRDGRVDFGVAAKGGFARSFRLLGADLGYVLAILIGGVLLVVPGLLAATRWFVTGTACVLERRGVVSSFARSADLTKGSRWRVLAIFVVTIIPGLFFGLALPAFLNRSLGAPAGHVCAFLWYTLGNALYPIIAVVVYHDLRAAKEGLSIAAVFD
jgi:hypothetical protein